MTKKLKILHVVSRMNRGGIETYLMNMLRNYDRTRFQMDFCYLHPQPGDYAEEIIKLGSKMIPCRMHYDLVRFIPRLIRILRQGGYQVIDAHPGDFAGPSMLAAALAGVPVRVASYHNVQPHHRTDGVRGIYARIMHLLVQRFANVATGCSQASLDAYFPGWPSRRDKIFKVRYYGIDYERFANNAGPAQVRAEFNIPQDCAVIGHVGRICQPKNHRTLIDAAALLLKERPNTRFLLVGDGPLKSQAEEYVKAKSLADYFVFTGRRSDIPQLMSAMDIFFFPSLDEGFGLVLLEAQASGAAIVASAIAGIAEAVAPVYRPSLTDPQDAPTFARSLIDLLDHPPKCRRLIDQARTYVQQNFSMQAAVDRFQNLYLNAYNHYAWQAARSHRTLIPHPC